MASSSGFGKRSMHIAWRKRSNTYILTAGTGGYPGTFAVISILGLLRRQQQGSYIILESQRSLTISFWASSLTGFRLRILLACSGVTLRDRLASVTHLPCRVRPINDFSLAAVARSVLKSRTGTYPGNGVQHLLSLVFRSLCLLPKPPYDFPDFTATNPILVPFVDCSGYIGGKSWSL